MSNNAEFGGLTSWLLIPVCLLAYATPLYALETRCHIHPPAAESTQRSGAALVGPFDSERACLSERQRLFGAQGRCHCTRGFASPLPIAPSSNDWLLPNDGFGDGPVY